MAKEDRETIINFLESDDDAQVYTCNRKWKNKLAKLGFESEDTDAVGGQLFTIPREYLQIRKPREMTAEQAEAGAERLRAAREAAGVGEYRPKTKKAAAAKKKATAKPTRKPKAVEPEEEFEDEEDEIEEEDLEDEDVDEDEDEDDEEEEVVHVRRKAPAAKAKAKPVRKTAPVSKKPVRRARS